MLCCATWIAAAAVIDPSGAPYQNIAARGESHGSFGAGNLFNRNGSYLALVNPAIQVGSTFALRSPVKE